MTSWNGDQRGFAVKHRKSVQPQGYNSTLRLRSAAHTITDLPSQMDAALQPSALPAALLNTQVKKIKDTRCLVCQRTGLCSLFRSFTRRRARSSWILRLECKKWQENFTFMMLKTKQCFKCVSLILRWEILHLIVWSFSHNKRGDFQLKKHQGLELFAFLVSDFKREKVSSDLSHMHCRYMGRSRVKGWGFNNITFLSFAVLTALRELRFIKQTQVCVWVHRSKQLKEDDTAGNPDFYS